jgi:hypothetical protein
MKSVLRLLIGKTRYEVLRKWRYTRKLNAVLAAQYSYDEQRFRSSASILHPPFDAEMLGARIMMDCHRIEKGLALSSPRAGFGRDALQRLFDMVPEYEHRFGSGLVTRASRKALQEYRSFNVDAGLPEIAELDAFLANGHDGAAAIDAGTKEVKKSEIEQAIQLDFDVFARTRFSVRNFTGAPVAVEAIKAATLTALKTPSVCNRQSGRVHALFSQQSMTRALSFQNGNRGFGDRAGAVLIITSDMRSFIEISERNQCWVDGGMFAMSLCYALHGLGYGTCMLNWSATAEQDRKMREAMGIGENEAVITMMAVGHLPEHFKVAVSPRRDISSILRVIG